MCKSKSSLDLGLILTVVFLWQFWILPWKITKNDKKIAGISASFFASFFATATALKTGELSWFSAFSVILILSLVFLNEWTCSITPNDASHLIVTRSMEQRYHFKFWWASGIEKTTTKGPPTEGLFGQLITCQPVCWKFQPSTTIATFTKQLCNFCWSAI